MIRFTNIGACLVTCITAEAWQVSSYVVQRLALYYLPLSESVLADAKRAWLASPLQTDRQIDRQRFGRKEARTAKTVQGSKTKGPQLQIGLLIDIEYVWKSGGGGSPGA
tara:strand:+ start:191 stop:517 length:327 start_codon:yes stop_codon:yes gene_type:complete